MTEKENALHRGGGTARGALAGVLAVGLGGCGGASAVLADPRDHSAHASLPDVGAGADRVGIAAPPVYATTWIERGAVVQHALDVAALRGHVVVVRFWTDTCAACRASAPAFAALDRAYADRGLVVLALHHPKPPDREVDPEAIARVAQAWGLPGAIGLDADWRTLDAWWLDGAARDATSATFVLDRAGVIRWVHPGPELHPDGPRSHARCRRDFADLERAVRVLLNET